MKTKPKPKLSAQPVHECYPDHDFFQVSEPAMYGLAGSSLGALGMQANQKAPRFICRKCGKVIQLA